MGSRLACALTSEGNDEISRWRAAEGTTPQKEPKDGPIPAENVCLRYSGQVPPRVWANGDAEVRW